MGSYTTPKKFCNDEMEHINRIGEMYVVSLLNCVATGQSRSMLRLYKTPEMLWKRWNGAHESNRKIYGLFFIELRCIRVEPQHATALQTTLSNGCIGNFPGLKSRIFITAEFILRRKTINTRLPERQNNSSVQNPVHSKMSIICKTVKWDHTPPPKNFATMDLNT